MEKLIYIIFLFPLLTIGQIVPFGFMETTASGPANLYDTANAISPVNESNTTTDISVSGMTLTSEAATGSATGSYMAKATGGTSGQIIYIKPPSGLAAGTYDVSIDVSVTGMSTGGYLYVHSSADWSVTGQDNFVNTDGTWETLALTGIVYDGFVDSASGRIRIYTGATIAAGDIILFDNVIWGLQ